MGEENRWRQPGLNSGGPFCLPILGIHRLRNPSRLATFSAPPPLFPPLSIRSQAAPYRAHGPAGEPTPEAGREAAAGAGDETDWQGFLVDFFSFIQGNSGAGDAAGTDGGGCVGGG